MPPLIHTWTIQEIQLDTTPSMPVEYGDPLYIGPTKAPCAWADPARGSWRTLERTDSWEDDGSYRLRRTLEDVAPRSTMSSMSPHGPLLPPQ